MKIGSNFELGLKCAGQLQNTLLITKNFEARRAISRLSLCKLATVTDKENNIKKQKQICKLCSGSAIENQIHQLLDCPVYKDLRDNFLLGTLKTDEIDLSYGNRFEKLKTLFTQRSLKPFELLEDYIYKAIEKCGAALRMKLCPKTTPPTSQK